MMRYQIILEFDEDWIIDVVMRMLQEKRIDCFYHVIDTEEMEPMNGGKMNIDVMFSSETNEWSTPQDFYDELNKEFGFTLDPCATKENAKCETYFTIEQDGLKQDWEGHTTFVNPPYGRAIKDWVKKCYEESLKPNTKVVMLIPARTDTKYFHEYIYHKAEIRFIKGRLKFGDSKNSAPFPSMVVIF